MLRWASLFTCWDCPRFCVLMGRCGQSPLDTASVFAQGTLRLSELHFYSISALICFLSILFWEWRSADWCHHISSDQLGAKPCLHQPSSTLPSFLLHLRALAALWLSLFFSLSPPRLPNLTTCSFLPEESAKSLPHTHKIQFQKENMVRKTTPVHTQLLQHFPQQVLALCAEDIINSHPYPTLTSLSQPTARSPAVSAVPGPPAS